MQNPNLYHYLFVLFDLLFVRLKPNKLRCLSGSFCRLDFCVRCLKAQIVGWFYSVYFWEINIFVKTVFLDIQPGQPCSSDMSGDLIHAHGHTLHDPHHTNRVADGPGFFFGNPLFCFIDKIFDLPFIICYSNCGKFLHLATNFLNNNNSDCAGWIFLFADKHG